MKALADDAGVTIEIKPFSKTIRASAVPTYLDNIFLNFITNAIKYKNPKVKSELTISVSIVKSSVAISFADNGLGIDLSKNRSKLFGMYKVFHKNKDARGIGLFITKNQIESMNGEFKVESQVGKGSTFTVILNRE